MRTYCVLNNFPDMNSDSILIFDANSFVCSYRMEAASHQFVDLLWDIQHSRYIEISSQEAVNCLNKERSYNFLTKEHRDEVQLAYRASRNNFFQTLRDLNLPDSCGDLLNERSIKMEEAKAIFDVVRRVFETEIRTVEPFESLHRIFDGAPEEIIEALHEYECVLLKEQENG